MTRKQKGQIVETARTWFIRYYTTVTENGQEIRKQTPLIRLCEKSDRYRFKTDVQPLADQYMASVNKDAEPVTGSMLLGEYVTTIYLPWVLQNKAPSTYNGYAQLWNRYLSPCFKDVSLLDVQTHEVTKFLTHYAQQGFAAYTLSHMKFMLHAALVYAVQNGVVSYGLGVHPKKGTPVTPASAATWHAKVKRPRKQVEYSIQEILNMITVLEPINLHAAVVVAVCYFTSCRPAEARGLRWEEWNADELEIKRGIWRNHVGDTKTEGSAAKVPVVEPLKSLLAKLRQESGNPITGYIFQNSKGKSLSLDSLNYRIIAPALKAANIKWAGYYPCRRGISSLVTDLSKNPLNSTGLLRHSTPVTALQYYTRPQAASVKAAMNQVEELANSLSVVVEGETVQ